MKINVKMLDECGIKYDWITLYIGISVNLVECKELSIYALKELENNEDLDNEFIIEVAWGNEDYLKELPEITKDKLLNIYIDWLKSTSEANKPNLPICAASRGRNIDNPSSRVAGLPTKQRLEINYNNTTNTLTSVLKDNYIIEPVSPG